MLTKIIRSILGLIKVEYYIVLPDKTFRRVKIKTIPDVILIDGKYYSVIRTINQIVGGNINRIWIQTEESPIEKSKII